MFCLRSWIPILFFLTNASPIYLLLFISATYSLNRPCVYCSLLLAILVLSLFDFNSNWFEPHWMTAKSLSSSVDSSSASSGSNNSSASAGAGSGGDTTPGIPAFDAVSNTISILAAAANSTAGVMVDVAADAVKQRFGAASPAGGSGIAEGVKSAVVKREWRVPHLDVLIRL
ncbi:hypothetical protein K402DRAFT_444593 [Aulographum hederae CBS 113979]|uniref:Uncharacterized protein n=1 Tax=Aulographum hederae CBS 113979 TaxID=1176131 RepID=A0A6G1HAV6_9PEZI|nr:hypothetical protein K402DRAFT_444593 [Aulographum hederae CBS 113979]